MTDLELDDMLLMLQTHTAISRCNLAECRDIFRTLKAKGYTVTKPPAEPADRAVA